MTDREVDVMEFQAGISIRMTTISEVLLILNSYNKTSVRETGEECKSWSSTVLLLTKFSATLNPHTSQGMTRGMEEKKKKSFPAPCLINNGAIGDRALFCHLTSPPQTQQQQAEMLPENRLQPV